VNMLNLYATNSNHLEKLQRHLELGVEGVDRLWKLLTDCQHKAFGKLCPVF
jgi:hypothetical protein